MASAPFDEFYTLNNRVPLGVAHTLRGLMAPIYVVESYASNNGVGGMRQYAYTYEDARVDIAGRGYLGFAKVIVRDVKELLEDADDLYTVRVYRQQFPYTGLLGETQLHLAAIDPSPLSEVTNVYAEMPTFGAAVNAYLKSSSDKRYDRLGNALATTNTDNSQPTIYGNTREIKVGVVDHTQTGQNHSTTTVNTYGDDDAASWRLGRLTQEGQRQDSDLESKDQTMTSAQTLKQQAHEFIDQLHHVESWEKLAYHFVARASIERGLADVQARRVVDGDAVLRRIEIWGTDHELPPPRRAE